MEASLKPIETDYAGYRFRSRLEARWAVWFDALKVEWNYELQGYDLGREGWFLPDFWLPEFERFVEVKPERLLPSNRPKPYRQCEALAKQSGKDVWMVFDPQFPALTMSACGAVHAEHWRPDGSLIRSHVIHLVDPKPLPTLSDERLASMGEDEQLKALADGIATARKRGEAFCAKHGIDIGGQWLINAFRDFRSARFEHGQSGPAREVHP